MSETQEIPDALKSAIGAMNSTAATGKKPPVVPMYQKVRNDNPAVINKVYREGHKDIKPMCTVKWVTNSRIYGTRGTGGSRLAKSALRLAIDTGVQSPATFNSSSIKSKARIKPFILPEGTAENAVNYLNSFEVKYGGKCTPTYRQKMQAYKTAKQDVLLRLGITTSSEGKPLFKDDTTQVAYFKEMEALSFPYYEVYLSVQPKGGRATRSTCFRATTIEELKELFPKVSFVEN